MRMCFNLLRFGLVLWMDLFLCLSWFVSIGIVVSTNTYENVFQFIAIWFGFTDGGMKKLIGINYLIFVGWITKLPTIV